VYVYVYVYVCVCVTHDPDKAVRQNVH